MYVLSLIANIATVLTFAFGLVSGVMTPSEKTDCGALLRQGEELLAEKKLRGARKLILETTKACPNAPEAYDFLGLSYDLENRFKEAQEAYRKAIAINPRIAGFHDNLAVSYFRSGDQAAGVREFQKAIQLDPRNKIANINLATHYLNHQDYRRAVRHLLSAQVDKSNDAVLLLELTQAYFGAGEKPAALETAAQLSRLAGSDAKIRFSLGLQLAQNGEYQAAVREFGAIAPSERDAAVLLNLGITYSKLRRFSEAREAYEEALRLDSSNPEPYLRMGLDFSAAKKPADAIYWITQAREKAPQRADIGYALAEEFIRARNYDKAQDLLSHALKQRPSHPILLEALGDLYAQQHHDQEAAQAYLRCLRYDPRRVSARFSLSRVYLSLQRTQEARSELRRVLEVDPHNAAVKAELGRLALEAGQQDLALQMTEQALAQDPNNLTANEDLAKIKLRDGRLAEAQATLEKLIKLDPDNPRFHYMLSRVLSKVQRTVEAQSELDLSKKLEATQKETRTVVPSRPEEP